MNVLSLTQQYLCSNFYVQLFISTGIKADIKYSYAYVLLKCKTDLILPMDQSKSLKNDKKIELEF